MRAPEWDFYISRAHEELTKLRILADEAAFAVMEARVAAEDATATSLELMAEADRVLASPAVRRDMASLSGAPPEK